MLMNSKIRKALRIPVTKPVIVDSAVFHGHSQIHSITDVANHTSTATSGQMLKADANGLPVDATNTDTDVASAVTLKHAAVTVSAPIALSTQALSLVNDVAATVTEIDTGVLGSSDTTIPTSQTVVDAIATHAAVITSVHGLIITAGQTITVEASSVVNQDLTTDASPTFVTAKLSGLTDDYIPYHVNDATGLANGPTKTNVDSAVNLKHTAGTDTALGAVGTKDPPIDADLCLYRDSAAANVLVTSTWAQIKAFLKTYFDTLYVSVTGRYRFAAALADDATQAIPTITANYAAHGFVIVSSSGVINESAEFEIDSTGTCQIIRGTANMVINADTDTAFCLGTAAAQNPMTFRNRLGGARNVMINLWYA